MRLIYSRPILDDLSQGSRIAFARQFRFMSQDELSDKLGITGENKRRTMTRYEKGQRNPKEDRTKIIAEILNINYNAIKKYDYKEPIDIVYTLIWLEELIPNYSVELESTKNLSSEDVLKIETAIDKWKIMKSKRDNREISYKEYINWKLTYDFGGDSND
jgi:transcriptional regulator with XRE-family HTH domain